MNKDTYFVGLIFIVIGLVFAFNNVKIAKGAFRFYQKLYTEKNLSVMFRISGILLALGGIFLVFFK
jgi:hypothetical protein